MNGSLNTPQTPTAKACKLSLSFCCFRVALCCNACIIPVLKFYALVYRPCKAEKQLRKSSSPLQEVLVNSCDDAMSSASRQDGWVSDGDCWPTLFFSYATGGYRYDRIL